MNMAWSHFTVLLLALGVALGLNFRMCIPATHKNLCNSLDRAGSQVVCDLVESRIDCALRLARGQADIAFFNAEETILLGQVQPNDNRVVATIRDVSRTVYLFSQPFAFEAVAIVSSLHQNGFEGLRNARYCHPGLDQSDLRWSPRVLKAFENDVAKLDQCSEVPADRTAEEIEVEQLNKFFSAACRPGPWSLNATVDARLKSNFTKLCSLCGNNSTCNGYKLNMGDSVSGVDNNNRHIQALECLRMNGNGSVAYVAWQYVRKFFKTRNPEASAFAVLCPDGSTRTLTSKLLSNNISPCAFVRQPWSTIVARTGANAASIQQNLKTWWPNGENPGGVTWQAILYNGVVGGSNARVFIEEDAPTPANYTSTIRPIPVQEATATCIPPRRWCTLSEQEHNKCQWVRAAAYSLGIQPTISCQQRSNIFECMKDIKEKQADFIASNSRYGYLARQHYNLSPVKLLQNARSSAESFSRVAAFVRESSAQKITSFENLRGKRACFPEFGGIPYMAFVKTAQDLSVISRSECDYARAVGEFFAGACAGGALDAHTSFKATSLCSLCRPTEGNSTNFTCASNNTNLYFGNNGTLSCLANPESDVAFLEITNIENHLKQAGLEASQVRALCRNNTLAATTGVNVDDGCLLAHVVDAEVLTRRNDSHLNALSVLLENLDFYFNNTADKKAKFIDLEIFSSFDRVSSTTSSNQQARDYIELFRNLESCAPRNAPAPTQAPTQAPASSAGSGIRNVSSFLMLALLVLTAQRAN